MGSYKKAITHRAICRGMSISTWYQLSVPSSVFWWWKSAEYMTQAIDKAKYIAFRLKDYCELSRILYVEQVLFMIFQ